MYEAWIDQGNGSVRIITIEATGIRSAYRLAEAECADGEFCRGVNPVEQEVENV